MTRTEYFTKQRLAQLEQNLSARDHQVLASLSRCRYLTTLQIARLYYFGESVTHRAAVRAANRSLARLREDGLIRPLQRRIGGVRAGSGSFVWALTPGGARLLQAQTSDPQPRKQFREPTLHFLTHTLVIAEAYLQLTEICAQHGMVLADVQFEPECWRRYGNKGGKAVVLKPDLYAVTQGGGYEEHRFIEIDCATETVARIVEKCERYIQYLRSGVEQGQTGVFPYVVWIVPDAKRKGSVERHIRAAYPHGPDIFIVILPDELEALIRKGIEK